MEFPWASEVLDQGIWRTYGQPSKTRALHWKESVSVSLTHPHPMLHNDLEVSRHPGLFSLAVTTLLASIMDVWGWVRCWDCRELTMLCLFSRSFQSGGKPNPVQWYNSSCGDLAQGQEEQQKKWGARRGCTEVEVAPDPEEGPGVSQVEGKGRSPAAQCS